jgi:hypothetical protein
MNPKLRNSIAEIVSVLSIADAAIPQLAAATHIPAWVGVVLAILVNVGNQLLKDSTPPPTPSAPVNVGSVPPKAP